MQWYRVDGFRYEMAMRHLVGKTMARRLQWFASDYQDDDILRVLVDDVRYDWKAGIALFSVDVDGTPIRAALRIAPMLDAWVLAANSMVAKFAAWQLGGHVVGIDEPVYTNAKKGENARKRLAHDILVAAITLSHTAWVWEGLVDDDKVLALFKFLLHNPEGTKNVETLEELAKWMDEDRYIRPGYPFAELVREDNSYVYTTCSYRRIVYTPDEHRLELHAHESRNLRDLITEQFGMKPVLLVVK